MTNGLNTIAEELRTTAISKLPEAISVSEGDCILVVQNRKAKRARPSLFRGPKGDTGMAGAPGTIGPTGASPVLRYTTRGIESKLSNQPDTEFTLLVPIADMTGPQGTTGANIVLRAGDTGIEFKLSTEPDSAYKVLVPYLQITGPKGNTGPAPILELGEVTTVEPSDPASATFQPNGVDPSGANKYRLALSIPKGKSGQDGTGAGNVLVNNEASLLASKQYAFKPGQDGSVNGAFVEVEARGKAAIPIPYEITGLNNESTSDEIKAALGGDEGFERIYEGAKNGVCFLDMSVASGGVATGGFICQSYQSGIESGAKMIVIGADLSSAGAGLFQCMIAKEGDVYSIDSNMQEEGVGYTGWIDRYFYMNSVIHLRDNRFSTGMSSDEINNALKFSAGLQDYFEAYQNTDSGTTAFDILYYYCQVYSVPVLYTLYLQDEKRTEITYFPKITTSTSNEDANPCQKIELSVIHDDIQYILSIEEQPDGTLSCVKEERSLEVSKSNVEKVLTGNIISHTHDRYVKVTEMPTDVWDGTTVSTALAGSGTVDDPYLIQSCADYIHFYRNPNLYGHAIEDEPSEEQKSNFKQVKFSSHLDFGNHPLDLGDAIIHPDDIRIEGSNKFIALVNIEGQGCRLSNINFLNTWGVIPLSMYCSIKNLHVISGIFTIPLSFIHDKVDGSEATVTPWGLFPGVTQVEDVSFVAELKFVGDIATDITFISGAIIISSIASEYPGIIMGEKPYFYSNVTYSCDDALTALVTIHHAPAYMVKGDAPVVVTGYDYTKALKDISVEPTQGLAVTMIIVGFSDGPYTVYINTDNALPIYASSSPAPFHTAKTTAEMKSPEFLALLNGDTETFVADTENINDGYPIFKPRGLVETYDGYVKESVFEAFKTSVPTVPTNTTMSDGYYVNKIAGNIFETQKSLSEAITELGISATKSTNIINLDLDISGYMSRATEAEQTAIWGKMYTAPTSENIITLLGGAEGVRQLCEKLKPTNNPIVTVPYMLYFLPTRLLSTSVSILIADSTSLTNILSSPRDGCYINIALMFYTRINDPISIVVNLIIANFNTDTQQVSYEYLENSEFVHIEDSLSSSSTSDALSANQGRILDERIDKKVGSEDITTIKKLTQAAYDALSSKDTKTLYACIQTNGTIVMRLPL